MKQLFSIFILTVFLTNLGFGQKKIKDNVDVTFEMSMEGDDELTVGMMNDSTMRVAYSADQKSRATVNMMGGFIITDVITEGDGKFVMLMDMMGQKIKVVPTEEEMEEIMAQAEESNEDAEVTYDKKDTKEILGYTCHKATVTTGDNAVVMYVTNDIEVKAPKNYNDQTMDFSQVEGFPLEIIVEDEEMKISFLATEIKELAADAFDYDASEYEEMSYSELSEMGGM